MNKGDSQKNAYQIIANSIDLNTPYSLQFYYKYIKMYLFMEVCCDLELLTIITQFLDLSSLLNFTMINTKMYELLYGIQTIQLRIVKAKLSYYEERVVQGKPTWKNYSTQSIDYYTNSTRLQISQRLNFDRKKNIPNSSNFSHAIFSTVYQIFKPQKLNGVNPQQNGSRSSKKLKQLKKINKKSLVSHQQKGRSSEKQINKQIRKIQENKRYKSPQRISYREHVMRQYGVAIDKNVKNLNNNLQKANKKQTKNSKYIRPEQQKLKEYLKQTEKQLPKKSKFKSDGQIVGFRVPRVMQLPENIVIRQQSFMDRLKAKLAHKFAKK